MKLKPQNNSKESTEHQEGQKNVYKELSRLTVPMPPPATTERKKLTEREESGEFTLGDEVVEQEYTHFRVTPQAEIAASQSKISARRITLVDIRKKLLRKQCSMQTFEAIRGQRMCH